MAPFLHHMTIKHALKQGVRLEELDGKIVATHLATGTIATGMDGARTLEAVIDALDAPAPAPKARTPRPVKTTRAPAEDDDGEAEEEEESDANLSGSIVRHRFKARYAEQGHPDNCGDGVAAALRAAVIEEDEDGREFCSDKLMAKVARDNGHAETYKRWAHLNPGQRRMNLGNVLRGLQRRGEDIVIDGQTFAGIPQAAPAKAPVPKKKVAKKRSAVRS